MDTNQIYLLGEPLQSFKSNQLPTKSCVLKNIYHFKGEKKTTIDESVTQSTKLLISFYEKQGKPTTSMRNIKAKIQRLHRSYSKLRRNRARRSTAQTERESKFKEVMREVFLVESTNIARATKKKMAKKNENVNRGEESDTNDGRKSENVIADSRGEVDAPLGERLLRKRIK